MSLLSIPTELRLHIYTYLPDLQPTNTHELRPNTKLTPSITRVCQTLRHESLPIYASNTTFNLPLDANSTTTGLQTWLSALGPRSIPKIRSLTISRHWSIPQPLRWQGHVGFYVRIERRKPRKFTSKSSVNSTSSFRPEWNAHFVRPLAEGIWEVTTGTYPVARDIRGMRLESVELLAEVIRQHLHVPTPLAQMREQSSGNEYNVGLTESDVNFLVQAMDAVARHPISTYDIDQAESARRRRLETWTDMEQQLRALNVQGMVGGGGDDDQVMSADDFGSRRFFTPY
ncbi:hypothetical protein M409DRAFT_19048 [Zasmidium cellare ATCC 36951]|uniref:F-box domain-containing protein n=1 Tax=Zasmidium cellare ATCC 36951 TaxID=1080233 RepID=A0A6A6D0A7_ZASCE|nr:uncharacterized protein M409DRAFT_19048 [Zasmidium cellare ATCC 36951]KAF2171076.1 hypothetical protein M409DRAFT_19048 [Zasmidium cellare ATCC 36951]